jgi:hypothetical protein
VNGEGQKCSQRAKNVELDIGIMLAHKDRNAHCHKETQHKHNQHDNVLGLGVIHEDYLMPQNPKQAVLK